MAAWPSVAANDEVPSGLTDTGVGILIIAVAVALLSTLLFRATATHIARIVVERIGRHRMRKILHGRSTSVMEDFILPGAYGGLTRIDYAILTSGGVLCIQTKHCNGTVFGEAKDPQWTNVDGVHRRRFLNPLIQNAGRSRALQNVIPQVPVGNLVVFTGAVQFTSVPEKNVVHIRDLERYISRYQVGSCKIKDWDAVWMTLKAAALTDEESRKDFEAQLSFS